MKEAPAGVVVAAAAVNANSRQSPCGRSARESADVSLRASYEVDRLAAEIVEATCNVRRTLPPDVMLRVALQLPDPLLSDAPDLCWEMEQALTEALGLQRGRLAAPSSDEDESSPPSLSPLVYCLGDTTLGECCADVVAAQHLRAHVLVHYGPSACLSPCDSGGSGDVPLVLYSFGNLPFDVSDCVNQVLQSAAASMIDDTPAEGATSTHSSSASGQHRRRYLLLYQVPYAHAMEDLQTQLSEQEDALVIVGQLPHPQQQQSSCSVAGEDAVRLPPDTALASNSGCEKTDCCASRGDAAAPSSSSARIGETTKEATHCSPDASVRVVVGLELPRDLDWPSFSLLFVGDPSSREFLHASLRFHSILPHVLVYDPALRQLTSSEWSPQCARILKRRFYLIQKARQARAIGVLVANASDGRTRDAVTALLRLLESRHKSVYVFAVGKINAAKLANFAEIDCFVLVACPGHALFHDPDLEREFATPLVSPLEMAVALGYVDWGTDGSMPGYSLDLGDFLALAASVGVDGGAEDVSATEDNHDDDADAPYFSLVTGRYESLPQDETQMQRSSADASDLTQHPGKGVLTSYRSVAADFLQGREYRGLKPDVGLTPTQAAVPGQRGIASDYGNR